MNNDEYIKMLLSVGYITKDELEQKLNEYFISKEFTNIIDDVINDKDCKYVRNIRFKLSDKNLIDDEGKYFNPYFDTDIDFSKFIHQRLLLKNRFDIKIKDMENKRNNK